mmetsp:Transcript_33245/g.99017  ORF Transcript_33245/g.99017 Transcript_33245/m.99017 type:complete len:242 (+) Transcript_33245:939-1664(+)
MWTVWTVWRAAAAAPVPAAGRRAVAARVRAAAKALVAAAAAAGEKVWGHTCGPSLSGMHPPCPHTRRPHPPHLQRAAELATRAFGGCPLTTLVGNTVWGCRWRKCGRPLPRRMRGTQRTHTYQSHTPLPHRFRLGTTSLPLTRRRPLAPTTLHTTGIHTTRSHTQHPCQAPTTMLPCPGSSMQAIPVPVQATVARAAAQTAAARARPATAATSAARTSARAAASAAAVRPAPARAMAVAAT